MANRKKVKAPTTDDSAELAAYKAAQNPDSVNAAMAGWALVFTANQVTRVTCEYAGQGDSGQIESIGYYDKHGVPIAHELSSMRVDGKTFEDLCYEILDIRGWNVNNEGSQGNFTWDLAADTMDHHHEDNVVSVEVSKFEGISDLLGRVEGIHR